MTPRWCHYLQCGFQAIFTCVKVQRAVVSLQVNFQSQASMMVPLTSALLLLPFALVAVLLSPHPFPWEKKCGHAPHIGSHPQAEHQGQLEVDILRQ